MTGRTLVYLPAEHGNLNAKRLDHISAAELVLVLGVDGFEVIKSVGPAPRARPLNPGQAQNLIRAVEARP